MMTDTLLMNLMHICPSCHSETRRLVYCAQSKRLVCAESCALTDADLFFLELFDHTQVEERLYEKLSLD